MKKILKIVFICLSICMFAAFAVSCGSTPTDTTAQLEFLTSGAVLEAGESFEIEYEKIGDGEIEWASLDKSVATVKNGTVSAVGEGDTKIIGKIGEVFDTFTVKVEKGTSIPSLKLSDNSVELVVGGTTAVILKTEYKGKEVEAEYCGFTEEENANVAGFSLNGGKLTVTALNAGSASVTVWAKVNGNLTAENLTVTVRESKPLIVVSNAKPAVDGYTVDVAAIENPSIPLNFKPEAYVYDNNQAVTDAVVNWTMEENSYVGYGSDGYFGKSAGSATLIGTYGNESVRLTVNCVRPVFDRADTLLTIELADGFLFENVTGTTSSITAGETEIYKSTDKSGKIQFKLNALKISEYNIDKTVTLTTDKAAYKYSAKIFTDIITSEEELNEFPKNALASATAAQSANGYFLLGNDIVCTGNYKAYDSYPFGAKSDNGFQGVFDGNGKIIKNLKVTGDRYCGFIPMMGINGVLKNVIFQNCEMNGNGGFISCHSYGKIENVYIEVKVTDNSTTLDSGLKGDNRLLASVLASEAQSEMVIKNVFVKYVNTVDENSEAGHVFVRAWSRNANGLIVVGHGKYYSKTGTFSEANSKSYLTEQAFSAATDWKTLAADYSSSVFNVTETGISPSRSI